MKRALFNFFSIILLILTILLTLFRVYSFSIASSNNSVLNANIFYINQYKLPYYIILHINSKYDNNVYKIKVTYDKTGDVVYSKILNCKYKYCETKILLTSNIFLGKYKVDLSLINKEKLYKKTLYFSITKKVTSFTVVMPKIFYYTKGSLNLTGTIYIRHWVKNINKKFKIEVVPETPNYEITKKYDVFCKTDVCKFSLPLKNNIIFGNYKIYFSNKNGILLKKIKILPKALSKYNSNFKSFNFNFKNNNVNKIFNQNTIEQLFRRKNGLKIHKIIVPNYMKKIFINKSFLQKNIIKTNKLVHFNISNQTTLFNLLYKEYYKKFNGLAPTTSPTLRYPSFPGETFSTFAFNSLPENNNFNLNSTNNNYNNNNFNSNFNNIFNNKIKIVEHFLDGSFKVVNITQDELINYKVPKGVDSISLANNNNPFEKEVPIDVTTKISDVNPKKLLEEINKNQNYIQNSINSINDTYVISRSRRIPLKNFLSRAYKPGIYKVQEGNKTKLYAFGLISINTRKPLYHPGETVNFIMVVLDKNGYPVNGANIILNVVEPNGTIDVLSSLNNSITRVGHGIYYGFLNVTQLGHYKLYAETKVDNIIVNVSSYFNVVKSYPFEIIRDVPPTIDPWSGPFLNNFTVTPLIDVKSYDFYEYIPASFKLYYTNADEHYKEGDTLVLVWKNRTKPFHPSYVANSPLISPYLYELGKAKVVYSTKYSLNNIFYENRSWQFAIDPAAQVCGFKSSCVCGSKCNGGGEPGSGTIDSCSDGDTEYEYVNNIWVTDLNGSYFGTGDTVQICVEDNCDTDYGGDRIQIAYKDASHAWSDSDIIYVSGGTDSSTACVGVGQVYCINQTLTNYVGTHNVRATVAWRGSADVICPTAYYRDIDDINFTVLPRVAAAYLLWDLNNGTTIGDNLGVIRGFNITAFAKWNKPIQKAVVHHNANGVFTTHNIEITNENWTNYTFVTKNLTEFPKLGPVQTNITSWDLYFNLSNTTSPMKTFTIYGMMKINQSWMQPYVMYNGTRTNIACQVVDQYVGVPYSGVTVKFYNNVSGYLGSAITNGTGWANISYVENNIGTYTITCNVSSDLSKYLIAGPYNYNNQILTVKENGTDITPPSINWVNIQPAVFSVGGTTTITANVTDNVKLVSVYVNITYPDGTSKSFPMKNISKDIFQYNFSDTTQDGIYKYYIYAFDNSSNKGWSPTYTFIVEGIETFIGIKTTKNIYKLGETINLTPYTKIYTINTTSHTEKGDVTYIFFNFDTGFQGWTAHGTNVDWQNGVPSASFINKCDEGNCMSTNLTSNYQPNADEWLLSPEFNFSGRTDLKVRYWRMVQVEDGTDQDRVFFQGYDGSTWHTYYQDSLYGGGGPYELDAGYSTYYTPELEGKENAYYRFLLTSDSDDNVYNGWGVDSVNISFTPRENWNKAPVYYNTSFGTTVEKVTAIKIRINVTGYSAQGSIADKDNLPNIIVRVYNGTAYDGYYNCYLDPSRTYPYICEFVIKNTPEFLKAWENPANRKISVQAINLDHGDYITWTDVKREYITPSIVENHGEAEVTSYLLEQFRNSSGSTVKTMYNQTIDLLPKEAKELSVYWNFKVPWDFKLGKYSAYVALTDAHSNVLFNNDDGTPINDSYDFYIESLLINPINPTWNSVQKEDFLANISLNTTYFGSGGWCAYNIDNTTNISMNEVSSTNFDQLVNSLPDGRHFITFYCNDTDGYIVRTLPIYFNVSEAPRINFISPTDADNSYVNRSWTYVNVSVIDASNTSAFIDFNRSLIGYWNFENISGTTLYDLSTYNNNGILENGVNTSRKDMIRGTYGIFDGSNDYVDIPASTSLEIGKQITISAWVKWNGAGDSLQNIFTNGGWSNALRVVNDGSSNNDTALFQLDINGTVKYLYSNIKLDKSWHLITGVYNGSEMSIYIDGSLDNTLNVEGNINTFPYDNYIGTERNSYYFNGSIDEVLIFNRGLTASQIKALYNSKINKLYGNFTMLMNNKYSFSACAIDAIGNVNCSETRVVNINRTLPFLNITHPINNSKFTFDENNITINCSSSQNTTYVKEAWVQFGNGTNYSLTSITPNIWSTTIYNMSNGKYSITCFAKDFVGNIAHSKTTYFYVLPDIYILVDKTIIPNSENNYLVNMTIKNLGKWKYYDIYDLVSNNLTAYNFNINPNSSDTLTGIYSGKLYSWNLTMLPFTSVNINYKINGTGDYYLLKDYIIGQK